MNLDYIHQIEFPPHMIREGQIIPNKSLGRYVLLGPRFLQQIKQFKFKEGTYSSFVPYQSYIRGNQLFVKDCRYHIDHRFIYTLNEIREDHASLSLSFEGDPEFKVDEIRLYVITAADGFETSSLSASYWVYHPDFSQLAGHDLNITRKAWSKEGLCGYWSISESIEAPHRFFYPPPLHSDATQKVINEAALMIDQLFSPTADESFDDDFYVITDVNEAIWFLSGDQVYVPDECPNDYCLQQENLLSGDNPLSVITRAMIGLHLPEIDEEGQSIATNLLLDRWLALVAEGRTEFRVMYKEFFPLVAETLLRGSIHNTESAHISRMLRWGLERKSLPVGWCDGLYPEGKLAVYWPHAEPPKYES